MATEYVYDRVIVHNWDGRTTATYPGTIVRIDLPTKEQRNDPELISDPLYTVRDAGGRESIRWAHELTPADPCCGCGIPFAQGQLITHRIPVSDRWPVGYWHDTCWDNRPTKATQS